MTQLHFQSVPSLPLPLISCVTLHKSFNFSVSHSHVRNGDNNITCPVGQLWGFGKLILIKSSHSSCIAFNNNWQLLRGTAMNQHQSYHTFISGPFILWRMNWKMGQRVWEVSTFITSSYLVSFVFVSICSLWNAWEVGRTGLYFNSIWLWKPKKKWDLPIFIQQIGSRPETWTQIISFSPSWLHFYIWKLKCTLSG